MHAKIATRSNRYWLAALLAVNVVVAFLGLVANPYRLLPFNLTIPGINDIQPALYKYLGYVRIFDLANRQFDTIVFGTSRVMYGIDPQNPLLRATGDVYNAGVFGAQIFEMGELFDHALANQKHLKLVIVGLDLLSFNDFFDDLPQILQEDYGKPTRTLMEKYQTLAFDFRAILDTIVSSTLRLQTRSLRRDGMVTPDPLLAKSLYQDILLDPETPDEKPRDPQLPNAYRSFAISRKDMQVLTHIVSECQERGIKLLLFFTPTYLRTSRSERPARGEWKTLEEFGMWPQSQQVRAEVARLHPYWDFDYPSTLNETPDLFLNRLHFSPRFGDVILERMLAAGSANVGTYVDAQGLQRHLEDLDLQFARFDIP